VTDLDAARLRWLQGRPEFERFGKHIEGRLRSELKRAGLYSIVDSRAKTVESLLKKLILKPHYTFETLPDKAGARVVVRYLSEVDTVAALVAEIFDATTVDKKSQGSDRVGYLGTHLDVRLFACDPHATSFPPHLFQIEVQVHTRTQNLWADMSHACSYKGLPSLSEALHRRVNLLAGLLEVADNEFTRINDDISQLPDAADYRVLQALEHQYYKFSAHPGNSELSLAVIHALLPLYSEPPSDWEGYFENVYANHQRELEALFRIEDPDYSVFLFQPEVLLILDRLRTDQYALRESWDQHFPPSELQRFAIKFGAPYD
jgi:ppGpp synthetase/RelA/SpoT-type nucleotidyltranferase